jgi:hypothetical protein
MEAVPHHPILVRERVRTRRALRRSGRRDGADGGSHLAPITATYEKLPAVAEQEAAMKDGAPRLHDEVPSNWPLADLR